MLNKEKVGIYKIYKGYYDGYYIQNKDKQQLISDNEWILLDGFIHDIFLIRNKILSKSFEDSTLDKIKASCDNEETFIFIIEIEKYLNTPLGK